MSPPASCRARLQSIMPAPVRSRSVFTSPAEICAASMSAHLLVGSCGLVALLGRLHVGTLLTTRAVQLVGRGLVVALGLLDGLAWRRRLAGRGLGLLARVRLWLVALRARRRGGRIGIAGRGSPGGLARTRCGGLLGALRVLGGLACLGLALLALGGLTGLALRSLACGALLGLAALLFLALAPGALLLGAELGVALADHVGHRVDDQLARADR